MDLTIGPGLQQMITDGLYLLALINPVSKISMLSANSEAATGSDLTAVVIKASIIAFLLLTVIMVSGDFILRQIFHVELHSLFVSGGAVLVWMGFIALRRGVFFEQQTRAAFADLAIVPLSCPMIAGPATIAACVALTARHGAASTAGAIFLAVLVNGLFMLGSKLIARFLTRFNVMGALIRITGLVVMTVGVQMVFNGLQGWAKALAQGTEGL